MQNMHEVKAAEVLIKMHGVVEASQKAIDVDVYREIMVELRRLESGLKNEDLEDRFTYAWYIWNLANEGKEGIVKSGS